MSNCTNFCHRLKAIEIKDGVYPSHNELAEQLEFTNDHQLQGQSLGTWQELQSRTRCSFCQFVVSAILSATPQNDVCTIRPEQPVDILLFPGEQSFRLSYPSQLGLRLAFVAQEGDQPAGPDTARLIRDSKIPISRIQEWLRICNDNHKDCSEGHSGLSEHKTEHGEDSTRPLDFDESATSNFRVIDLQLGCIKPAALDVQYVALSYVWGQSPMFRLQKDNFQSLLEPGSLDVIRGQLPNTVRDALGLVKALGLRYAWIDALCLVQDEEDDVSLGIEQMNSIYQGSYFTVVAGSGSDATAGLPGVGASPRSSRQIVQDISPSVRMAIIYSIDWHLQRSVYNQRGWTLQEIVLPRRTAIFIHDQIYFRCREANWSEDSWADKWTHWIDTDDGNISRIPDPRDGFLPSLWAYQKLVEDYSSRTLRSDGDALRAVAGILRPLAAGMKTDMVEGMPGYYLDQFLLFISSNGNLRRRPEFASFSWAGWEGSIMWPRENYNWFDTSGAKTWKTANMVKWLKHGRVVAWNSLDSSGNLQNLSFRPWDVPSMLVELMRQHPTVFPTATDEDPEHQHGVFPRYNGSSGGSGDVPMWDSVHETRRDENEDEEVENFLSKQRKGFSIKEFDLANSQAEFDGLVRRLEGTAEKLVLRNWMAHRRSLVRRALSQRSNTGPLSTARRGEASHYQFRRPRTASSASGDKRREYGNFWAEKNAPGEIGPSSKGIQVPKFPPYTVLQFLTISLNFTLGVAPQHTQLENQGNGSVKSPFSRIPGIQLCSSSGQTIGSLHADNIDLMGPPGSKVECLVISRCSSPTTASALLTLESPPNGGADNSQAWDLLWVLAVVWRDGIAERRGVGQVLASALEMALEPGPQVKLVLLG